MKKGFTMAGAAHGIAFTMAEILLSLTIIGVVAAITLPSLTGNINERTWNTQRKALFARFSQAIALMPALNGYGTLTGTIAEDGSQTITEDNAAETFIAAGLSKVLKINNICSENYQDCGFPAELNGELGSKMDTPVKISDLYNANIRVAWDSYSYNHLDTKAAAFETGNGESILLFYNPTCVSSLGEQGTNLVMQSKMCANLIFDLNGNKGPNTVGKDIGIMTIYYPTDSVVVTALPATQDAYGGTAVIGAEASKGCTAMDSEYRLPNLEEIAAIYINADLIGRTISPYWASTRLVRSGIVNQWHISLDTGILGWDPVHDSSKLRKVMCVKR